MDFRIRSFRLLNWILFLSLCLIFSRRVIAAEAEWIWSPAREKELVPQGDCFFRKTFHMGPPESGEVHVSCDDSYELFVNGQRVGTGTNWKKMNVYNVTKYLVEGENVVAIKGANTEGGTAALAARVLVKEKGNTQVTYSSDKTWRTSLKEFPGWQKARYEDKAWLAAQSFGKLGVTPPWGKEVVVEGSTGRFKITPEFRVELVADAKDTGSLIAMTFDEFGQIIAAREGGELVVIRDEDKDGIPETVKVLCPEMQSCQGLACVSGRVFAVGQGPKGAGLYKLADTDHDGKIDEIELLLKFKGDMAEHGPHGLTLGPDGLLYIVVGNFSGVERDYESSSPHHHYYEGDLLRPKYEDAKGHAEGITAPGGTIIRTDTSGSAVELVAGGFQNPYDLVFNRDGELFTSDSDMEWDQGMPWYRSTRLNHVIPGGEYGWRSGWSKWPEYYPDSLPPTIELGRGSPTGIEVYNHVMYPSRYHNAAFVCDWSRGRILVAKNKPHGATFKTTVEVFLEGAPLNVTDLVVGPDGWLYFCNGGRGTEGGVYRIVWEGNVPAEVKNFGTGITAALKQPQLQSAWSRQQVAVIKQKLGPQWGPQLFTAAQNDKLPIQLRTQALSLMQLFGPAPPAELLVQLSKDTTAAMRVRAAQLMGMRNEELVSRRLVQMLDDSDAAVQRATCEAITRSGAAPRTERLVKLLESPDRHVAWAARRLLQTQPARQWQDLVLDSPSTRAFVQGATALLALHPNARTCDEILGRCSQQMTGYLSDVDFVDLLRVIELALIESGFNGKDLKPLRGQLVEEFPSKDFRMNRELSTLLAYLQEPTAPERFLEFLESDAPNVEKMQIATRARFVTEGWTTQQRLDMLQFFEEARNLVGGNSFQGYVENVSRDFFAQFNEDEMRRAFVEGHKWPTAALSVLAKMPEDASPELLAEVQHLDEQLRGNRSEAARKLKIGIAAVLGSSGNETAMQYLRDVFASEPERRVPIAMALAQHPDGENWPLLVQSLSIVEGTAAQEVLTRLTTVDKIPEKPEGIRQAILRGLMLKEDGAVAIKLLVRWTGQEFDAGDAQSSLAKYQAWFAKEYPSEPVAELPLDPPGTQWTYQELLSQVTNPQKLGDYTHGERVFEKAQCAKCHRYGERGDGLGPDLSNVSRRFQKKEILESVLFPSQVISDQYTSRVVRLTDGRVITGFVSQKSKDKLSILQANGQRKEISTDDVESQSVSAKSVMPEGLLDTLSLDEIMDLFAYMAVTPDEAVARRAGSGSKK
jgi:putative membrane-bound dehydrogenase-like protein